MARYFPATREDAKQMLQRLGLETMSDLYRDIPAELRAETPEIPAGLSEMEAEDVIRSLADRNTVYRTVLRGAGAYDHYIPAIVDSVATKEAFLTTYTPYQAEISQGTLQAIFEYQTMIASLTGMDLANASLYDGASAAAEATVMCEGRKRTVHLVSEGVHPQTRETVRTYAHGRGAEIIEVPLKHGETDWDEMARLADEHAKTLASVLIQQPNCLGQIEDAARGRDVADRAKANYIMAVNPISLAILQTPGEAGADIACGEGQPLGMPLSYGGPYLGFLACRQPLMRKIPGRIAGETTDRDGKRAYVLTLQTREQHIRREKATSNVCTNQALCALRAGAYLAAMGPRGLRDAATLSVNRAHALAEAITALDGFERVGDGPFFHEFVTTVPCSAEDIVARLAEHGILAGLPLRLKDADGESREGMLWCATERVSEAAIREVAELLEATTQQALQSVEVHEPTDDHGDINIVHRWEVTIA